MNNKIIALAVAGALSAPMLAQAAPTAYGRMAVEIAQTSNSSASTTDKNYVVDNKAGQFGFKGSEDLGGGLKAIYKMEFGIETTESTSTTTDSASNTDTAANTIFAREKMIGLQIGKAHTVALGSLKSPYKYAGGVKYDSFAATSMQAREGSSNISGSGGAMSSGALGHGGFLTNSVAYTGKFKPVTVSIATNGFDDATSDSPVTSFSVKAKVSSFEFGVASIDRDSCLAASSTTDNCASDVSAQTSTKVFGSWSKGQHTVRAQVENVEVTAAAVGSVAAETDFTWLNYQFKMGKHLIDVALGEKDVALASGTDEDFTRVAYAYNFSKKTRVFAGIAENDATNTAGTANDWDTFSVGMQVKF